MTDNVVEGGGGAEGGTTDCAPGSQQCDDGASGTAVETCDSHGQWGAH